MDRYIPQNATEIHQDGLNAVVYTYTDRLGQLSAIAYSGKRHKADFHYIYHSEERRQASINSYFDRLRASHAIRAQRRAEYQDFRHTLKVGDILDYSWGYDQTNVDFFQVLAVKDKSVVIRQIQGHTIPGEGCAPMSGYSLPLKDRFVERERPMLKRVRKGNCISMDYGTAEKWDGVPSYTSWYA